MEVLDPTHDSKGQAFELAPRSSSLEDAKVGVISNGKAGTRAFFAALEAELRDRHGVASVELVTKANMSAPAEPDVLDRAKEWNAIVSGIGD